MSEEDILTTKKLVEFMMKFPKSIDPATLRRLKADRMLSIVICSDAGLDFLLEMFLNMSFHRHDNDSETKKLFDPYVGGILVSIIQKARIAYVLGLIDKTTFRDITYLHKIRNFFAHKGRVKFTDADICKVCMKLSTARKIKKYSAKKGLEFFIAANDKCLTSIFDSMEKLHENLMVTEL